MVFIQIFQRFKNKLLSIKHLNILRPITITVVGLCNETKKGSSSIPTP